MHFFPVLRLSKRSFGLLIGPKGTINPGHFTPSRHSDVLCSPSSRRQLHFAAMSGKAHSPGIRSLQHPACLMTATKSTHKNRSWHEAFFLFLCLHTTRAVKLSEPENSHSSLSLELQLMQLGFTLPQAQRILRFFSIQKRCLSITTTQLWLQMLRTHNLEQPLEVAAAFPIILISYPQSVESNATAFIAWLCSLGLDKAGIAQLVSKSPMLLKIPHRNALLVAAWLSTELRWSRKMVITTLTKFPHLFSLSVAENLVHKLAWFVSKGYNTPTISKMIYLHPQLLGYSIARNKSQMLALQAMSFSQPQVAEMVGNLPTLLMLNIASGVTQAKVRFLTQLQGRSIQEILWFPRYLSFSLADRIGPRWAFFSLYCPGQNFNLMTRLCPTDNNFTRRLQSPNLNAECTRQSLSRLQLFVSFKANWKGNEGREWVARSGRRQTEVADHVIKICCFSRCLSRGSGT